MPSKRVKKTLSILLVILTLSTVLFSCAKKEQKMEPDGLNVYKSEGRYGYNGLIDGKPVTIEPRYAYAYPFSGDLAVVLLDRKMGYINTRGEFVIPNRYERAYNFSEGVSGGLARVRINGKYGFIDRLGQLRIDAVYDDAWDFRNSVAKVKTGNRVFFVDTDNRTITNFTEEQWTNFPGKMKKY